MSEINKEKMGKFISQLRKEKGMTQKELAEKLFISPKAVSKWETAVSIPDVNLLMPLADILGITVTELLQSEKIASKEAIDKYNVEKIVEKAIKIGSVDTYNNSANRRLYIALFMLSVMTGVLETLIMHITKISSFYISEFIPFMIISMAIGAYFTFAVKEKIPVYYDDNKISFYTDGIVKLNMPGLYFNNSNWPYIVKYIKYWSYIANIATPVFFFAFVRFIPMRLTGYLYLAVFLLLLFVPVYVIGKRYE